MEINLLTIFLSGLLLSFTPCVLPILPIIQKTISVQNNKILSSFIYVFAMSFVYALIGLSIVYLGQSFNLQHYIQSQIFSIVLGLFFILISLSMFDLYEIKLPQFIQNSVLKFNQNSDSNSYLGVFFIGGSSALILSPCVTAPLAGILAYVSTSSDPLFGFSALFLLGFGMGLPLIFISLGLNNIKKGSNLGIIVKYLSGSLLFIVGIWFITNSFNPTIVKMGFFFILLIYISIVLLSKNKHLIQGSLIAYLLYFTFLSFNGIYVWKSEKSQHSIFQKVNNITELENRIVNSDKPFVILDFYATWCSPCLAMETEIFSDKETIDKVKDNTLFLQIDLTETTDEHRQLMETFSVFGPPSVLLFDKKGTIISRADGSVTKSDFLNLFKP